MSSSRCSAFPRPGGLSLLKRGRYEPYRAAPLTEQVGCRTLFRNNLTPVTMNTQHTGDLLQLVSFVIENEEFGIDILTVQEIIRHVDITRVPNAPSFVEGVINLRGHIVPVVDLRKRFGLPSRTPDKDTRIVVVELDNRVVGFVLDAVKEVTRVDRSVIEPAPDLTLGIDTHYIKGVAKLEDRLLILLDLSEVLSVEEQQSLTPIQEEGVPA